MHLHKTQTYLIFQIESQNMEGVKHHSIELEDCGSVSVFIQVIMIMMMITSITMMMMMMMMMIRLLFGIGWHLLCWSHGDLEPGHLPGQQVSS